MNRIFGLKLLFGFDWIGLKLYSLREKMYRSCEYNRSKFIFSLTISSQNQDESLNAPNQRRFAKILILCWKFWRPIPLYAKLANSTNRHRCRHWPRPQDNDERYEQIGLSSFRDDSIASSIKEEESRECQAFPYERRSKGLSISSTNFSNALHFFTNLHTSPIYRAISPPLPPVDLIHGPRSPETSPLSRNH